MGKQIKWRCRTKHQVRKSATTRIEAYLEKLKRRQDLTTNSYLVLVHNFIKRCVRNGKKPKPSFDPYRYVRVCKQCENWRKKSSLVECFQCQDVYHEDCKDNDPEENEEDWICGRCEHYCRQKLRQKVNRKSNLLPEARYVIDSSEIQCCRGCRRQVPADQLALCVHCEHPYHSRECFPKIAKGLVCQTCDNIIRDKASEDCQNLMKLSNTKKERVEQEFKPPRRLTSSNSSSESYDGQELIVSYSTELGLRPTPAMNAKDKRDCSFSLLYAITSRKMRYTESLVYQASRSNSLLSIDLELETMNKKDIAAFRQYKRDPIGPYIVVPAEGLGYDVKAIKEIPRGTIICEYIGEVISKRTAITTSSDNDSLMELFVTNDADTTLLIRPQINTNIARFINGVNNSDPEAWKRINLQSVRLRIEGEPRVLLYARRNIQNGESLIYDYNAGGKELFPTDGFL